MACRRSRARVPGGDRRAFPFVLADVAGRSTDRGDRSSLASPLVQRATTRRQSTALLRGVALVDVAGRHEHLRDPIPVRDLLGPDAALDVAGCSSYRRGPTVGRY